MKPRLALTGGLCFDQTGIATSYSDDIGLIKVNSTGLMAGTKYYFFPLKWVVQPYIGANLYTNFLNLKRSEGKGNYIMSNGYPNQKVYIKYDVQCPALSIAPHLGADIHLFKTFSLTFDVALRYGLGGHHGANLRFVDGVQAGNSIRYATENYHTMIRLGAKLDFPLQPIHDKNWNNLLLFLRSWIENKAHR